MPASMENNPTLSELIDVRNQLAALEMEATDLQEQNDALLAMLRKLEWITNTSPTSGDTYGTCPICVTIAYKRENGQWKGEHSYNCPLGKLLKGDSIK